MTQETDFYTAHEVARRLGISPARVRQMLRAGELEGKRGPVLPEGVPGPWRVPVGAVSAYGEGRNALAAADADETVALPPQEIAPSTPRDAPGVSSPEGLPPEEAPSETSERLSEGVGALRDKAEEIERKSEPKCCRQRSMQRGLGGRKSILGPGGEDRSGARLSEVPGAYRAGRCPRIMRK
jgi:hypothetical protein